ncbi:hypothetical protein EH68_01325 [Enterococcus gallinarum]|nr:hypothetical protein [Enterococcus gallinarum]KIL83010.1 hypothetical protein EH68_01325 [Enterococcus gallinarum]
MNDKEKELEKIADQLLEKAAEMNSLANQLYMLIGHVKIDNYEWTADGKLCNQLVEEINLALGSKVELKKDF